jgi:hypothetical protein
VVDSVLAERYRFAPDILAAVRAASRPYVLYLLRHRIMTAGERPAERVLRVTLLTAVLAWAVLGGWWPWLLLLWFVPLVTTQVWIGAVAELMEHFPLIETAPPDGHPHVLEPGLRTGYPVPAGREGRRGLPPGPPPVPPNADLAAARGRRDPAPRSGVRGPAPARRHPGRSGREIYRSLPLRRDQADTALVGVGA